MMPHYRKLVSLAVLAALLVGVLPMATLAQPDLSKVHPAVLQTLDADGRAGFYAILAVQADLSGAQALRTKVERTTYVFEHLRQVAQETQQPLLAYLSREGVAHTPYYIQNMIRVESAGRAVVEALAGRPDVAQIMPLPNAQPEPTFEKAPAEEQAAAIEWNITRVKAPDAWALGYRGEGMVVASNDTGVQYNHPALVNQYRGNLGGGNFDHNYNWWNGAGSLVPSDSDGHGTHTTGTMVGDDGGANQIGVAPGAEWIACGGLFNVDPVECFQFFLTPWNLQGQNPDPARAPDSINNSWYDPSGFDYRPIIQNLNAAGIAVIKSAGNLGPGCSTISNPGYVPEIIATAAFSNGDVIASFSSRGPMSNYGQTILKPEVAAPGVSVRSSYPTNTYSLLSGTSMAAPHTTAFVALIWGAAPCLQGDVPTTKNVLMWTAESKISNQCPPFVDHPNDVWGWGILHATAAIQEAQTYCTTGTLHINRIKGNWAPAAAPGYYKVVVQARIHDQDHAVVQGATVHADWTFPNGAGLSQQAVTDTFGRVKFPVKQPQCGLYQLCVTDITKTGYVYAPGDNEQGPCVQVAVTCE